MTTMSAMSTRALVPIAYDRNPRAILLEADITGGANGVTRDAHVPLFRLYGDGMVIFAGKRTDLTTGLDAEPRVGYLSEVEIQALLATLRDVGFSSLNAYYEPRPVPKDMPTASITFYDAKAKSVRVYAPDSPSTPKAFSNALAQITSAVPSPSKSYVPTDGYLISATAGTASELPGAELVDWNGATGLRLADATNGTTVTAPAMPTIAALVGTASAKSLFRDGSTAYRVRFGLNLPRSVHLTDWIGTILAAPREFEGRVFDLTGYYRGSNLLGEARGNASSKGDWVLADDSGAIYVSGVSPPGLDPTSRADAWSVVRVRGVVVYVRLGTSHIDARRVDLLPQINVATP